MSEKNLQVRRMMQMLDHKIPEMNRNSITGVLNEVHQEDFESLAEIVSIMRAKYLSKVVEVARVDKSDLNAKTFEDVRALKLAYQESIDSFNELKHALACGHFELSD